MTSPISWQPLNTADALGSLAGLTSGSYVVVATIDNTSGLFTDAMLVLNFGTSVTVGSSAPSVNVWALEAPDESNFASPAGAAAAPLSLLLGSYQARSGDTIQLISIPLDSLQLRPTVFILLVENNLGADFPAGTTGSLYRSGLLYGTYTPPAAPGQLQSFSEVGSTSSTVTVAWTAGTGGTATSWSVYYTGGGVGTQTPVPGGSFNAAGGTIAGLSPSTAYTFYAYASNAGGTSTAATLNYTTPGVAAPGALQSVGSNSVTSSTVNLTWSAPVTGGTPTGWFVNYTDSAHTSETAVPGGTFGATGGTVTGLAAGDAIVFYCYASNSGGNSPAATTSVTTSASSSMSVLSVSGNNFVNTSGRAVALAGCHTWCNGQDIVAGSGNDNLPAQTAFPFTDYLTWMTSNGQNCIRMWLWESYNDGGGQHGLCTPQRYAEPSTPGIFDVSTFNQPYFDRLLARVQQAAASNIYVIVQVFNGASIDTGYPTGWASHPFKSGNNINGVNGDPSSTGNGRYIHQDTSGAIWSLNAAFMTKLVQTLYGQPNVLYEIGNEMYDDGSLTRAFEQACVTYIKNEMMSLGGYMQPVGITALIPGSSSVNTYLLGSNADWVALSGGGSPNYQTGNIPVISGSKVQFLDTDHIQNIGGDWEWAWQAFMRGYNILYMSDLENTTTALSQGTLNLNAGTTIVNQETTVYGALGIILSACSLVDLTNMVASSTICSYGYCRADPTNGYYMMFDKQALDTFTMDLSGSNGRTMNVTWMDIGYGTTTSGGTVVGGNSAQSFTSPINDSFALILTP